MNKLATVVVVLIGLACVPGCSASTSVADEPNLTETTMAADSSSTQSSTTTVAISTYADQFLQLRKPVDDAFDEAFRSAFRANASAETFALFQPYSAALKAFDEAAVRVSWPESVRAEAMALVDADINLRSSLNTPPATSVAAWLNSLTANATKNTGVEDKARAALGLPPKPYMD